MGKGATIDSAMRTRGQTGIGTWGVERRETPQNK